MRYQSISIYVSPYLAAAGSFERALDYADESPQSYTVLGHRKR